MTKHEKLFLPSLRGRMGDWIYYTAVMKLKDIRDRVQFAEDIHKSKKLQEFIQRNLTSRDKEIADYLLKQPQHFFNSLIVGVYGGAPQWVELKVSQHETLPNFSLSEQGILGFLKLSGEETLFALDGQHRVSGIKKALKKLRTDSALFDDEVSVIFIGHKRTPGGLERTRRLFTTLNRYAKPVKLAEIIALDEDDIGAIVTRSMIDEHKLFHNKRLSTSKSNSIPTSDQESFTNIVFLYKCISVLLKAYFQKKEIISSRGWKKFLKIRPTQEQIDTAYNFIFYLWDKVSESFKPIREYLKKDDAQKFRNENGGCILFRPIGLQMFMETITEWIEKSDGEPEKIVERTLSLLSGVELDISKPPWQGLLWESAGKRMITASENRKLGQRLLLYMTDFSLEKIKTKGKFTKSKLLNSYASLLNKDPKDICLPSKVV
jgi:DNA sulfur modification protein DndB